MTDYDGYRSPDEIADENAEYARDAATDAFLDKHPRRTMNLEVHMDLVQGMLVIHVDERDGEDDFVCSYELDEVVEAFRDWLADKWDLYVKSQQGDGRRFPSNRQLEVESKLVHYQDGHREFEGLDEFSREHNVMLGMQQMFGE